MPSIFTSGPPALSRYVASGVLGLMMLFAATSGNPGGELKVVKNLPDTSIKSNMQTWAVSGATVGTTRQLGAFYTNGVLSVSGAIISDGVLLSTGSSLYYAGQGLSLNANSAFSLSASFSGTALEIMGTSSGRTLHAQDILRSSGTLIVEGATNLHGTASGNLLKIQALSPQPVGRAFQSSGSMIVGSGSTGNSQYVMVPMTASGWTIGRLEFGVVTAGTTNTTRVSLRQPDKGNRYVLSTPISIDSAEKHSKDAATPYVINTTNDDVQGGEMLLIDVDAVSTTPPKQPVLYLWLYAP